MTGREEDFEVDMPYVVTDLAIGVQASFLHQPGRKPNTDP
jgi:hypothetical protein